MTTPLQTLETPGAAPESVRRAPVAAEPARATLLLLLGSAIVWLVIAGILGLITSIQIHSPRFLDSYSFLTYGRAEALRETAFLYGWAANAGLAITLWMLGRLGGSPLRGLNWAFVGAVFWNLTLSAGMVGIAAGDMTSFARFQLPRYVDPALMASYGAIAIPGVLAWSGRRTRRAFAAQWYAVAALFLFPWLSSAAQVVLLWSPMRGVAQSIAASWYAQGVWTLWLAPMALGGAYYVVTKITGRVLPNYEFAPLAFWILIFAGAWTGGRHLVDGPVPVWIPTMAVVTSVVMLIHYAVIGLNLRTATEAGGTSIKFIRFGVVAYLLAGVLDTMTAFRGIAVEAQFTFVMVALERLALYGGLSMMFFGAIYFMVPRVTGNAWASLGLTVGHRVLVMFGVVVLVVTLAVAGWTQGVDLLDPKTPISDMLDHIRLSLLAASAAQLVLLSANLLLLVNFLQTIRASAAADVLALNPLERGAGISAP